MNQDDLRQICRAAFDVDQDLTLAVSTRGRTTRALLLSIAHSPALTRLAEAEMFPMDRHGLRAKR